MTSFRAAIAPYRPLLTLLGVGLIILTLSRGVLFTLYSDRVSAAGWWPLLMLQGIRADLIMLGYWNLLALLVLPIFILLKAELGWRQFSRWWLIAVLGVTLAMELMTPAFIAQYDVRPNRLFIEYLGYPAEVFSTLWNGFRGWLLISIAGISVGWFSLQKLAQRSAAKTTLRNRAGSLWLWPVVVLLTIMSIRSSFDHRPANPALFAVTADPLVNSLLLSSTYSVQFALYNMRHEADASRIYGELSDQQLVEFVRQLPYFNGAQFIDPELPTLHWQTPSRNRDKPLNIVIILEESLGYGFVERGLTPNLAALSEQGWWFEQMYATGTRSVRGIEAVVAGFPPSPARSTVKLSGSQQGFFTIADTLKQQGYFTEFVYGGEAHFDNMRSFFTGNGVQSIIDQNSFVDPQFVSSWGVSDEDLFAMAHERLSTLHQQGQPFFSLIFSSSNHEPFELPEGKIVAPDGPLQSVDNAVRYADLALGQFIQQARSSAYWQDTLFLIVADHDNRVYGDQLVPIDKFHIPAVIVGADLEAKRLAAITSQIDLAPTLLSLAGVAAAIPTIGQDLSAPNAQPANRALLQFNQTFALLEGDVATILQPEKPPVSGRYDLSSRRLTPTALNPQQAERALHYALLANWLYQRKIYHSRADTAEKSQ
ncbi:LTA synthase family protein [Pseudidiomarina mangrovi]|uniref:LTA synthase family protein n=1 Tax=Pseudidiomarina mangrovi TaxID=2487133 RepID=UPI000FCA587C|nr:LTA synthase family protein [Pseudidiomarina mangrovi]